jgi:hypothetical protein
MERKPLEENQVIVHVPKGMGERVKIEESDKAKLPSEIVVQVSKKRRASSIPMLGVIVK